MNTERLHLLIVEDEEAHVEAIRRAFDTDGASVEVHVARTLREYSELVATRPLDIVLMDLNLPDGRAVEILTHPPEDGPFPVIVMTAFGNQQIVVEVMKAGALDYVVKSPESFAIMPRTVERMLREWKLLQERKRAEAILRESEERFHALFEKAPLGYQSLDAEGRFIEVNQAWLETLGYSREEVIGKWFGDFLAPEFVAAFRERFPLFKAAGKIHSEFQMPRKNGERRFIAFEGRIAHTADGGFKQTHCILQDITERKRAEEAVVAIKERLQNTLNSMAQGYYAIDRDWRVVAVNAVAEKHFGKPAAELIGGTLEQATQGRIPDNVREGIQQVMTSGQPQQLEVKSKVRPGTWATNYIYPRDGGVEVYFTDITERKRAEEALAEEAIRRRILMDQSRDGIVVLDQDGKVFEANRRYAEMLGYSLDEVLQLHVWDWDAQWTREQAMEKIRLVDATGDHFETRHRRKDGTVYDVEISSNAAICNGQKLIFCVCRDITARKRAEQMLQDLKELYSSLVENLPQNVFRKDREGRFLFCNRRFCENAGHSLEEIVGKTDADLFPPQLAEAYRQDDLRVMESGQILDRVEENMGTDGRKSFVQVVKAPLCDADGDIIGIQGIYWDVTERMKTADALREQAEELRARNEELERFNSASVGRELRMIELKQEINHLCQQTRLPVRYPLDFLRENGKDSSNTPPTKPGRL
ncbi:MAG: PAS domain S-box protein [Verrucomicrobiia bacterium]|jgi:PAS domain S-box-containing protein